MCVWIFVLEYDRRLYKCFKIIWKSYWKRKFLENNFFFKIIFKFEDWVGFSGREKKDF